MTTRGAPIAIWKSWAARPIAPLGAGRPSDRRIGRLSQGSAAGQPRPDALVQPGEDHQVGRLHPRLQRAPDGDAGMGHHRLLRHVPRGHQRGDQRPVVLRPRSRRSVGLGGQRLHQRSACRPASCSQSAAAAPAGPAASASAIARWRATRSASGARWRGQRRERGAQPGEPGRRAVAALLAQSASSSQSTYGGAAAQLLQLEPRGQPQMRAPARRARGDQRMLEQRRAAPRASARAPGSGGEPAQQDPRRGQRQRAARRCRRGSAPSGRARPSRGGPARGPG